MRTSIKLHPYLFISCFLCIFLFFCISGNVHAQEQADKVTVSSFEEFQSAIQQMVSKGGSIYLEQDIIIPAQTAYTYNNGRYRKEVTIETMGHTIYIEGYCEFWPYLRFHGDGRKKELLHVRSGGELHMISIALDAKEDGIAVVQEEGAILTYGSEEGLGLPAFSCVGNILSSPAVSAAADWYTNFEKLPVIRLAEDADFTMDMLPDTIGAVVNRDYQQIEEQVPVIWEETSISATQDRALIQGTFTDGYAQFADAAPCCLLVRESSTEPYFLNAYVQSLTPRYEVVYMHGEAPQSGTIHIQSSNDGETWREITDTEGYAPFVAEEKDAFFWMLSYDPEDQDHQRPVYYRLYQVLEDGTQLYSDAITLSDRFLFTAADIEGGRGGETSPDDGEDQLPDRVEDPIENNEQQLPESTVVLDPTEETETMEPQESVNDKEVQETTHYPLPSATLSLFPFSALPAPQVNAAEEEISSANEHGQDKKEQTQEEISAANKEEAHKTNAEKNLGIGIVLCICIGFVTFAVFKKKDIRRK